MKRETLELKVKEAVYNYALSKEAQTKYYGQPGTGLIHPCSLDAVVNMLLPLYEENARLQSLLLLDEPVHK